MDEAVGKCPMICSITSTGKSCNIEIDTLSFRKYAVCKYVVAALFFTPLGEVESCLPSSPGEYLPLLENEIGQPIDVILGEFGYSANELLPDSLTACASEVLVALRHDRLAFLIAEDDI